MTLSEQQASATEGDVYESGDFSAIDIGARMREGHVDVADGDRLIVQMVSRHLESVAGRRATVVDIGSGSGVLSAMLAAALPQHRVVANDTARSNHERARARLQDHANAEVFPRPFQEWAEPADVFISWGSHHHLAHGYLHQIKQQLRPGGRFIVGDEFCPEYLRPEEVSGGRAWIVDGFLFTSAQEEEAYRQSGQVPPSVLEREEARRRALWNWYRFVIDQAVVRGDWEVALLELQIARDDLTTAFVDEHKTSPLLLETELKDAGFVVRAKHLVSQRPVPLQSFVVYEASLPVGEA